MNLYCVHTSREVIVGVAALLHFFSLGIHVHILLRQVPACSESFFLLLLQQGIIFPFPQLFLLLFTLFAEGVIGALQLLPVGANFCV